MEEAEGKGGEHRKTKAKRSCPRATPKHRVVYEREAEVAVAEVLLQLVQLVEMELVVEEMLELVSLLP